jgi:hypothetical protein
VLATGGLIWASARLGNPPYVRSTFAQLYCAQRNIAPRHYHDRVLREVLYRPAWWLQPLLRRTSHYFLADSEFVDGVGRIRTKRELDEEIANFLTHPNNRGFRRSALKLRISVTRMQELFAEIMASELTRINAEEGTEATMRRLREGSGGGAASTGTDTTQGSLKSDENKHSRSG